MALLEKIVSMKQAGMDDQQIVTKLKEEGVSLREINEAISQSRIKEAIYPQQITEDMQPSMMPSQEQIVTTPTPDQNQYVMQQPPQSPQTYNQETYQQYPQQPIMQDQQMQYYPDQYGQYQQEYPQDMYYQQGLDIETVREISKQETETAIKTMREELGALEKLKTDIKFQIESIENRLIKIESVIQELQTAIIRKIGEYGENLNSLSGEIRATQESFSKIVNPLIDKKRKINEDEENEETTSNKKTKKGQTKTREAREAKIKETASFEDYFR